jgi:hypothetical protein
LGRDIDRRQAFKVRNKTFFGLDSEQFLCEIEVLMSACNVEGGVTSDAVFSKEVKARVGFQEEVSDQVAISFYGDHKRSLADPIALLEQVHNFRTNQA